MDQGSSSCLAAWALCLIPCAFYAARCSLAVLGPGTFSPPAHFAFPIWNASGSRRENFLADMSDKSFPQMFYVEHLCTSGAGRASLGVAFFGGIQVLDEDYLVMFLIIKEFVGYSPHHHQPQP